MTEQGRPWDYEPYFSAWMERLTYQGLHDKAAIALELAKLSKAIGSIAPWLSASLSDSYRHPQCAEYIAACEAVLRVDMVTRCMVHPYSSRCCERGTKGCEVRHIPEEF